MNEVLIKALANRILAGKITIEQTGKYRAEVQAILDGDV